MGAEYDVVTICGPVTTSYSAPHGAFYVEIPKSSDKCANNIQRTLAMNNILEKKMNKIIKASE